jgi:hypothetical protein
MAQDDATSQAALAASLLLPAQADPMQDSNRAHELFIKRCLATMTTRPGKPHEMRQPDFRLFV